MGDQLPEARVSYNWSKPANAVLHAHNLLKGVVQAKCNEWCNKLDSRFKK